MQDAQALIASAIGAIRPGKEEPFVIDDDAVDRLRAMVRGMDSSAITFAIVELCVLAQWMALERRSPGVRDVLLDVAAEAIPALHGAAADAAQAAVEKTASKSHAKVIGLHVMAASAPQPAPRGGAKGGVLARFDLEKRFPKSSS